MFSNIIAFITALPGYLMEGKDFLSDSFEAGTSQLQQLGQYLDGISDTYRFIASVVFLLFALLGCFFGYRLCRLFMSFTGFLTGAVIGGLIGSRIFDLSGALAVLCCLAGAVILSLLSYRIYQLGIFILCFGLSFTAAASFLPFTGDIQFFLSVIAGFFVGLMALRYIRPVIIMTSAAVCGFSAAKLLITVCEHMDIYTLSPYSMILIPVIILLGCLVQFLTTSGAKR